MTSPKRVRRHRHRYDKEREVFEVNGVPLGKYYKMRWLEKHCVCGKPKPTRRGK